MSQEKARSRISAAAPVGADTIGSRHRTSMVRSVNVELSSEKLNLSLRIVVVPGDGRECPLSRQRCATTPMGFNQRPPTDRRTIAIRGAPALRLIARNSVHVRRLWARLAVDDLPSGNHRPGHVGAALGGGTYGAYRCATNGGGGWGPGHTGNVATASLRKASALEPQRLSRRRFPLSTPFGVTGPMKARSRSVSPFETSCQSLHPRRSAYDNRNRRRADRR